MLPDYSVTYVPDRSNQECLDCSLSSLKILSGGRDPFAISQRTISISWNRVSSFMLR